MKTKIYLILLLGFVGPMIVSAQDIKFSTAVSEEWVKNDWRKVSKITNTYDTEKKLTKQFIEMWDTLTNVYEKSVQSLYTYNANGTLAQIVSQAWDEDVNAWKDYLKDDYTYDASKRVLTETSTINMGGSWLVMSKTTNTYDTSGNLTKETVQTLNFMTMILANSSQVLYTYNANGTGNQIVTQKWNSNTSTWEDEYRSTFSYNPSKITEMVLDEVKSGSLWVNQSRSTYTINGNGTYKTMLDEKWDLSIPGWVNDLKDTYVYNTNGMLYQVISEDWVVLGSKWVNESRITFTYTTTSSELVNYGEQNTVNLYPNPFRDEVSILQGAENATSVEVINSEGKLVFSKSMRNSDGNLQLGKLEQGIYLFRINTPNGPQVIKMLKMK